MILKIANKARNYEEILNSMGRQNAQQYAKQIVRQQKHSQREKLFLKEIRKIDKEAIQDFETKILQKPDQMKHVLDEQIQKYKGFFANKKIPKSQLVEWEKQIRCKYEEELKLEKSKAKEAYVFEVKTISQKHWIQATDFEKFSIQPFLIQYPEFKLLDGHKYREDLVTILVEEVSKSPEKQKPFEEYLKKCSVNDHTHFNTILEGHKAEVRIRSNQMVAQFGQLTLKKLYESIRNEVSRSMSHERHYIKIQVDTTTTTTHLNQEDKEICSETETSQTPTLYLCSIKDCFHKDGEVLHTGTKVSKKMQQPHEQNEKQQKDEQPKKSRIYVQQETKTTISHIILEQQMTEESRGEIKNISEKEPSKTKDIAETISAGVYVGKAAKDVFGFVKQFL